MKRFILKVSSLTYIFERSILVYLPRGFLENEGG